MQPLFKLSSGSLLKSGLRHLARYCTHQEAISGRPEQVYLSFDQDCKDLGRGHYLSRTQINAGGSKCGLLFKLSHGQLLKSSLRPDIALIRCMIKIFGDHKFR